MSRTLRLPTAPSVTVGLVLGLLLALLVGLLVVVSPASPAQAAATQAAKTSRAEQVFRMPLREFLAVKADAQARRYRSAVDRDLDWSDDGCSAPSAAASWSRYFDPSCKRHDFGYRNFGKGLRLDSARRNVGLALVSTNEKKTAVDQRFRADMLAQCETYSSRQSERSQCRQWAANFHSGVAGTFGKANTAWHAGECHPGRLCLFDDDGYRDRRLSFTGAEDDMRDVGFGDKTSAVRNQSSTAWRLFEHDGYRGRSLCVPRYGAVTDLAARGFGDRTSSARPLPGAGC